MLLHRQAKAARGGEVERPRIAGQLPDDESEVAAAQAFLEREQRVFAAPRNDVDQAVAQAGRQPGLAWPSAQPERSPVLHPEPGALLRTEVVARQRQSERGAGGFVGAGKDFRMKPPLP